MSSCILKTICLLMLWFINIWARCKIGGPLSIFQEFADVAPLSSCVGGCYENVAASLGLLLSPRLQVNCLFFMMSEGFFYLIVEIQCLYYNVCQTIILIIPWYGFYLSICRNNIFKLSQSSWVTYFNTWFLWMFFPVRTLIICRLSLYFLSFFLVNPFFISILFFSYFSFLCSVTNIIIFYLCFYFTYISVITFFLLFSVYFLSYVSYDIHFLLLPHYHSLYYY